MHVLLDHLAATGIGTAVLLIVLAVLTTGRTASVDRTQYTVHREWSRTLGMLLEDDLRNAGAGVPPTQAALVQADTARLVIRRKSGFGSQPVETIAYEAIPDGVLPGPSGPVPVYVLERHVDGALSQRFDGLSHVAFELRDVDGAATLDLDAGRSVHVEATFGTLVGHDRSDSRSRYRRLIPMPNLALR